GGVIAAPRTIDRRSPKQFQLLARTGQPLARHFRVDGILVPSEEAAALAHSRHTRATRTGEWIEDQLAVIREQPHEGLHQCKRLLRLVSCPWLPASRNDE